MTTIKTAKRSNAVRVALTAVLACYLIIFAASTLWGVSYNRKNYSALLAYGALQIVLIFDADPNDTHFFGGYSQERWAPVDMRRHHVYLMPSHKLVKRYGGQFRILTIPLWLPLLPLLSLTAFVVRRERNRPPPGHCRKCGYDLTGNTSGRCPECGTGVTEMLNSNMGSL